VTDRVGFLSAATRAQLDARLEQYQRASGHQVLVYIDRTTGGLPVEDWAVRTFQAWKVGRRGIDDGLVVFVFSQDRKIRIEVGYGLEALVTDARASRIIREVMAPRIQAGDRDGAIRGGVEALLAAIGQPGAAPPQAERKPGWGGLVPLGVILFFFLFLLMRHPSLALMFLLNIASGRRGGGGGWGGGGGGFSGGGGRSGGGGATGSW
jgi:uncharacterized protein